jgi:spore germination cell wall hydrolase CwlJ-like protein
MVASGSRPKGVRFAPFGLTAVVLIAIPTNSGDSELGMVSARASALPERARQRLIASPFGTIHAATFSLPRPIGTAMPESPPVRLASLGLNDLEAAFGNRWSRTRPEMAAAPTFPSVDRTRKGDFLASRPPPEAAQEAAAPAPHVPEPSLDEEIEAAARFVPFPEYDISLSLEPHPHIPPEDTVEAAGADAEQPDISLLAIANDPDPTTRTTRLFFGDLVGSSIAGIVPWSPGEEPILMVPRAPDVDARHPVLAALSEPMKAGPDANGEQSGETVTAKGEVVTDGPGPHSPAERLGLADAARKKAERCLANAVYFESRGESLRGQIAVAQVVLNRAFSGYYPSDVCGVVYQNAHRRLSCQFTFACDRVRDVVGDQEAWKRATRVAKAALDGKVWLPQIGKATHYHASWVNPLWVRKMRKLSRIGVHSFYRPHRWGDGEEAPSWGSAATAGTAANL